MLGVAGKDGHSLQAVIADRRIFAAGRRGDTEALRRARDSAHTHILDTTAERPWFCAWLGREGLARPDPPRPVRTRPGPHTIAAGPARTRPRIVM